ncbi:MAG: hypothetical protein NTV51_17285 [Verrucomicrobia bacterium]|nr:hypothetical protein [Verrucomicrobiota bacterium]
MRVYAGGEVIATNEKWGFDPLLTTLGRSVGAFELKEGNDSALILTLAPGTYSAQVSGAAATTGVALIELYELP